MGTGYFQCRAHSPVPAAGGGTGRQARGYKVAKPELGTKRICPETGRKFYDLNKDPIVSPYTGQSYPRSYFESGDPVVVEPDEPEEVETEEEEGAEVVSLEDADAESTGSAKDGDISIDDDVEIDDDDDDDTFLADDEEDDDDVSDIIDMDDDDDDH